MQIPLNALQRPPTAQAIDAPTASEGSSQELADFSTAELSQQQTTVLRAIASGKGISAAAKEAGVSRPTIYRWQRDPHFQKWLAAWQDQAKESGHNIMLALIERSARILDRALDKDDVRVALTVLTKLGVLTAKDPLKSLPTMPGEGTSNEPETNSSDVRVRAGETERR